MLSSALHNEGVVAARVSCSGLRKALVAGVSATALMVASSAAQAACTDDFQVIGNILGKFYPAAFIGPMTGGAGLSAMVSAMNSVNTSFLTNTTAFVSALPAKGPNEQGGGVWSRSVAGFVDTSSTTVTTIDLSKYPIALPSTGKQTCSATTHQDYWGQQVGSDFSLRNMGGTGANWHFGVTGGIFEARAKDTTANTATSSTFFGVTENLPSTFRAQIEVPFVGVYTAFTQGNFSADAQVRWDFYQNTISESFYGISRQGVDAQGISVTANMAYKIDLAPNWFVEPSVGGVWSVVQVDPINVPGVAIPGTLGFYGKGTVKIDDIESLLGRVGVRVGTNITNGGYIWQPYLTAAVFHEFAGKVTSRAVTAGNDSVVAPTVTFDNVAFTSSTERVGTYTQLGIGTAVVLGNSGWLTYGRADYKTGENIDGFGFNVGLRYQW